MKQPCPAFHEVPVGNGTTYLGRNGNGKVKQIVVQKMTLGGTELIEIAPINSKGNVAQCYIQFPAKDLEAVIQALKEQGAK